MHQDKNRDFKFITRNLIKKIKIVCHRNHYRVFFLKKEINFIHLYLLLLFLIM